MSNTTDQKPSEPATTLAAAEDAEQMDLPIGVYGEGKYGECRSPTLQEQLAGTDKAATPSLEKTEA